MLSNERATIIAAAIGGICVFLAALIGLFTPVVSRVTERFLVTPTETPLPTATATLTPTETPTPLTPPTETPNPSIVFLVFNNFETDQDLYVDGKLEAAVDSGSYATTRVLRGSHILTNCARGKNPQVNPESCLARTYVVQDDPFFWELTGNTPPPNKQVIFLIRNISSLDIDFFVDGAYTRSVNRATYHELSLTQGQHSFQACPRGFNPVANPNNCGPLSRFDLETAVQSWTIHD